MSHLPQLEHDLAAIADRLAAERETLVDGPAGEAVGASASTLRAAPTEAAPETETTPATLPDCPTRPRTRRGRVPRRPVRPRVLAGVAAAAAAGGLVLALATGGGPGRLDLAEEAHAALAPDGGILHVVTEVQVVSYQDGKRIRRAANEPAEGDRAETWLASDPPRWRTKRDLTRGVASGSGRIGMVPLLIAEIAYGGGAQSTYTPGKPLHVVTGFSDRGRAAQPITLGGWTGRSASGGDTIGELRTALAAGELRAGGEDRVGGRRVLRLTDLGQGRDDRTITYFVDPATFAPVRVDYRWKPRFDLPPRRDGRPRPRRELEVVAVTDFKVFERLPTTPENERLLEITPAPGTKVVTRTLEEVHREMRRPSRHRP